MGEIADDMLTGTVCQLCGAFFCDEDNDLFSHGYPAVCWDCWKELRRAERREYQRAIKPTI